MGERTSPEGRRGAVPCCVHSSVCRAGGAGRRAPAPGAQSDELPKTISSQLGTEDRAGRRALAVLLRGRGRSGAVSSAGPESSGSSPGTAGAGPAERSPRTSSSRELPVAESWVAEPWGAESWAAESPAAGASSREAAVSGRAADRSVPSSTPRSRPASEALS